LKDQAGNAKIELERLTNYYIGEFVPRFSYTAVYHTCYRKDDRAMHPIYTYKQWRIQDFYSALA